MVILLFFCLFTARDGGTTQLLCWWALFANPILCKQIKTFQTLLYAISFFNSLANLMNLNVQMIDPTGIANWSVTHVDWSEGKWHPKAYRAKDVTFELLKNITVCLPLRYSLYLLYSPFYVVLTWSFWFCVAAVYWWEFSCYKRWKGMHSNSFLLVLISMLLLK